MVETGNVVLKDPTPEFVDEASFAMPVELERKLHEAQQQIDSVPGYNHKAHQAFTEWLWGNGGGPEAPMWANTGGALFHRDALVFLVQF